MRELIFVQDRKNPNNRLHFRLEDSLWERLFSEIAFLAESGENSQVRFWNAKGERMSIEITDELIALVNEHRHYQTDSTARHLAAYICEMMAKEEED